MRAGLCMTVAILLLSVGGAVGMERCEPEQATFDRMVGRATAPSPELIADAFILQVAVTGKHAALTRFWIERGWADGNLADLIAGWQAGAAERTEVASQQVLLDTLRSDRSVQLQQLSRQHIVCRRRRRRTKSFHVHDGQKDALVCRRRRSANEKFLD